MYFEAKQMNGKVTSGRVPHGIMTINKVPCGWKIPHG